jgi:hypothetical protein
MYCTYLYLHAFQGRVQGCPEGTAILSLMIDNRSVRTTIFLPKGLPTGDYIMFNSSADTLHHRRTGTVVD